MVDIGQRTHRELTDAITAEIQALFRLGGSRRVLAQQMEAAAVSLTPQALRVLERSVDADQTTPGRLAVQLDLDPATVTRLLRQLEDAGLVRRARDNGDRRVSTVHPTQAGREAFDRYREVIWGQVRRALASWPAGDLAALAELLGRLVRDVQKEPYRPVSTPTGYTGSNLSDR
jgi:DNA-binding MarR family transcriptional regulator